MKKNDTDNSFLLETLEATINKEVGADIFDATVLSLGIIWHQDINQVGAISPLRFDQNGCITLSRLVPIFEFTSSKNKAPLLDRGISRSPIIIKKLNDEKFEFTPPAKQVNLKVNGRSVQEATTFSMDELGEEIIIALSNSTLLSLFHAPARIATQEKQTQTGLIGISSNINIVRNAISRISKTDIPVLINGETGTGKELVARAIHAQSNRAQHAMININMAAISSTLANAELFGVKRGAFTGATSNRAGMFEQAHKKTLFLDEIGDTPSEVQPMLLRTLENGEIRRVGDEVVRYVDVRVISATDRMPNQRQGQPSFNQPLLQRLSGFTIEVPPLRKRRVDIGVLTKYFLENSNIKNKNSSEDLYSVEKFVDLCLYTWPGNVRELRNALLNIKLGQPLKRQMTPPDTQGTLKSENTLLPTKSKIYRNSNEVTDEELIDALDNAGWVIKTAAEKLNISRTAIYGLMEKSENIGNLKNISDAALQEMIKTVPGGIEAWAKHLRVGRDALSKRLHSL